jgi:hypothetical protein
MTRITKGTIALSALMSVGLVAAVGAVVPSAANLSFSAQVAHRFPLDNEMLKPMSAAWFGYDEVARGDRLEVWASCEGRELMQSCLALRGLYFRVRAHADHQRH